MTKRRGKRTAKQPLILDDNAPALIEKQHKPETTGCSSTERELERQIAAIKAISEMDIENLLTGLRLIRSYYNEDQLQTPVLQFFEENLPNVSVVRNSEDKDYDIRWKDEDGNVATYKNDERDIHTSLFHHMSMAYPSCSGARQSVGGLQFSAKTVKSRGGFDDLQLGNYFPHDSLDTMMLSMPEGFQTPGANSQRLSVGMTPKTVRLPKHGEMLLSVHGSPLGVYKEENMEAIHESEEG